MKDPLIRVTSVDITNVKSVKGGLFHTLSQYNGFNSLDKADVIGFYGQNGSGKTVVVEVFALLKRLLSPTYQKGNDSIEYLVRYKEEMADISFYFKVINQFGEFYLNYRLKIVENDRKFTVLEEELKYRENKPNKRMKILASHKKEPNHMTVRNYHLHEMKEEERVDIRFAKKMALNQSTSVIFREELEGVYSARLNEIELELLNNLWHDFNENLHVIETTYYGLLVANIIMPFQIHFQNQRGLIPYGMKDIPLVPVEFFNILEDVIKQINIVLKTIIPKLQIEIKERSRETIKMGVEGVRFELVSKRDDIELPLKYESEGILKVISILSTLIAVYNNPNSCVVIDELDAGIFEYLLGEMLEVLHENGKGQLIFTSHNLRILEVLPPKNLWFTTTNECDRYLQLTGVGKFNNLRDVYLRAVQLGGHKEDVYEFMDAFDMKRAFRKAGKYNVRN